MSAVDPTKQPIAALLQEWRDRAFAQPHNSTLDGLCNDLQAAIEAQCKEWDEHRKECLAEASRGYQYDRGVCTGHAATYLACIRNLKGEP